MIAGLRHLSDGRVAVYVSRERKQYSNLHDGYPLAESFLADLKNDDIAAIVIDSSDGVHVFDRQRYQRGDRLGHAPYPMKRVVPIDDADASLSGQTTDIAAQLSEWE